MSDLPKGDEESNKYPDLDLAQTVFEYEQDREGGGNAEASKACAQAPSPNIGLS